MVDDHATPLPSRGRLLCGAGVLAAQVASGTEKPGSTGNDSRTTVAVYYAAAANTADVACANRPERAGQPCSTKIAGAITGHDPSRMASQLPVRRVTAYNR